MIDVDTNRWFTLVLAIQNNHKQNPGVEFSGASTLMSYYKAEYKLTRSKDNFIFRIEFDDTQFETLFRLLYSEYIQ